MKTLIKKYKKKDKAQILHKLRIAARKQLSKLEKEGKTDLGLKLLLKKSSKLRDSDVLLKLCKNKKIKKFLKKKHKKLRKKFLSFLKNFKKETVELKKGKNISLENCFKILSKSFLNRDDKTLHKIRIEVKKCRYGYGKYENILKLIQKNLGKAHDFYHCEKLMKKFKKPAGKIVKKKLKHIKKAEKARKRFIAGFYS